MLTLLVGCSVVFVGEIAITEADWEMEVIWIGDMRTEVSSTLDRVGTAETDSASGWLTRETKCRTESPWEVDWDTQVSITDRLVTCTFWPANRNRRCCSKGGKRTNQDRKNRFRSRYSRNSRSFRNRTYQSRGSLVTYRFEAPQYWSAEREIGWATRHPDSGGTCTHGACAASAEVHIHRGWKAPSWTISGVLNSESKERLGSTNRNESGCCWD